MCALLLLSGCGLSEAPLIDTKGPIATQERDLLFTAFGLMLIVVVPVFVMTAVFCWRYRASGGKGAYRPEWSSSMKIETVVWLVPACIIAVLGYLVWTYTHKLDPYKKLASDGSSFEVQAIAQDWKWLFVYPELGVASVNELAFPSNRPLSLKITSDTVMNSFMIPALGGQIYAMAGMTTRLNLIADEPGNFRGRNTMYSGDGFSDQHFQAIAMSDEDFASWTNKVQSAPQSLDASTYANLVKPSIANAVTYYSSVEPSLFEKIVRKYAAHECSGQTQVGQYICRGSR
ncbi:MAG: ubiquinol oxidase subunit II [Stappiaceae bacterium]